MQAAALAAGALLASIPAAQARVFLGFGFGFGFPAFGPYYPYSYYPPPVVVAPPPVVYAPPAVVAVPRQQQPVWIVPPAGTAAPAQQPQVYVPSRQGNVPGIAQKSSTARKFSPKDGGLKQ